MKKIKIALLSFLLLFAFGCQTNEEFEDEMPQIRIEDSKGVIKDPIIIKSQTDPIQITVVYPNGSPKSLRETNRAYYSDALGLISWIPCSRESLSEVWTMESISKSELAQIINPVQYPPNIPTSTWPLDGNVPITGTPPPFDLPIFIGDITYHLGVNCDGN